MSLICSPFAATNLFGDVLRSCLTLANIPSVITCPAAPESMVILTVTHKPFILQHYLGGAHKRLIRSSLPPSSLHTTSHHNNNTKHHNITQQYKHNTHNTQQHTTHTQICEKLPCRRRLTQALYPLSNRIRVLPNNTDTEQEAARD